MILRRSECESWVILDEVGICSLSRTSRGTVLPNLIRRPHRVNDFKIASQPAEQTCRKRRGVTSFGVMIMLDGSNRPPPVPLTASLALRSVWFVPSFPSGESSSFPSSSVKISSFFPSLPSVRHGKKKNKPAASRAPQGRWCGSESYCRRSSFAKPLFLRIQPCRSSHRYGGSAPSPCAPSTGKLWP